jgi:acyl-coenzyme A synthetase/AMP-(fatty) acid ligase
MNGDLMKDGSEIGNLAGYLHLQAGKNPEKPAFLHPEPISFAGLDRKVDQLCYGLAKAGVEKGTRIIMLVNANLDFFILTFALLRMGAIPVLIDPGVGHKVMKRSLAGVEAEVFIGSPLAQLFRLLYRRAFRNIKLVVTVGPRLFWGGYRYKSLIAPGNQPFIPARIGPDDTGGIFFTSGSTGAPKGVIYRNRMFHAQINYFKTHYQWKPEEIDLCTFPLIGLFSVCLGLSVVIADINPAKPASLKPEDIWANLEIFKCTHMFGSPMILRKLAEYGLQNGKRLNYLQRIVTAGAPVPLSLLNQMKEILPDQAVIHAPYGATEALPVTDVRLSELLCIPSTANFHSGICQGRPLPGINLAIIRITESSIPVMEPAIQVPAGEVGEIAVSGPVVTESYLFNYEADNKTKIRDVSGAVWHRMGDVGRLDEEGRLWFYGRKNHRVEIKGGCLYTIPTEAIFNQIPEVIRSALVGIPGDPSGFDKPVICVQLAPADYWFKRKEIRRMLIDLAIASPETAVIQTFLFRRSFPVDPRHNAKIFREKLRKWAIKRVRLEY